MQKVIKLSCNPGQITEMLIFEFQGEFEHSCFDQFEDLELGDLAVKTGGNYEITCGNHLLRGKLMDLPKPIVLSERI